MQIIRGLHNLPSHFKQCVISLGNFDGVHLGHQSLISRLMQISQLKQLPAVVMLFEPQPLEFFSGDNSPARLTSFQEKCFLLSQLGVDYVLAITFNQTVANMEAKKFIELGLLAKLHAQHIIIGDDFRFGAKRQGDAQLLGHYQAKGDFVLECLPSYFVKCQRVSSTAIRQALSNDDFALAHLLLGRAYTIFGRVIHGNQLARQLGFPTANILLHRKTPALHGVYLVKIKNYSQNKQHQGIANIGLRPTINGKVAVLEVHIFDFDDQIYDQYLEIEFISKIRNEVKFSSLSALQQQIEQDICIAKQISAKLQASS